MLIEFQGRRPQIGQDVFIAPNAVLIGEVIVGDGASIWFGAVLRGDTNRIVLGPRSNVQDNAVVHVNDREATQIGAGATVGHGAVLEGCMVGDGALIGMNATVLSGAVIGEGALVAAGSLVREGQAIPAGMLATGVPARIRQALTPAMRARLQRAGPAYQDKGRLYRETMTVLD